MRNHRFWLVLSPFAVLSLIISACGAPAAARADSASEAAAASEGGESAAAALGVPYVREERGS